MGRRWLALQRSTIARFIALLFLSQLALTGGVLYFVLQSSEATLQAEQRDLVRGLRDDLLAGYRQGGQRPLIDLIGARLQAVETEVPVILFVGRDGTVLAGNLGAWPTVIPKSTTWKAVNLYRTSSQRPEPMGLIATLLPGGESLLTGHVIDGSVRLKLLNRDAMLGALMLSIPLALLLAVVLGRMINARVAGFATTAETVGGGDLSHRVSLDGSGDSFDALGHGVNAMLDRIETLVGELRIITDGLAHDLRSPITRLKSTLERAVIDTHDPQALVALQKVSAEADTLLAMLTTALQISRAEAGIGRERFVETDVVAMLADLVELYGPVAEEQGMALSCNVSRELTVSLHRELIGQALGNLIENAIKYAQGGSSIAMAAAPTEAGVILSVADDGPGIAEARRIDALKKFGRLDPARTISGSGLGLSLVEAVARLHGGHVVLQDNAPGLKVLLVIKG